MSLFDSSHLSEYSVVFLGNSPSLSSASHLRFQNVRLDLRDGFSCLKLGLKTEHQPSCSLFRGLWYCNQNELEMQLIAAFKRSKELFVSKWFNCLGSPYVCQQDEGDDGMDAVRM